MCHTRLSDSSRPAIDAGRLLGEIRHGAKLRRSHTTVGAAVVRADEVGRAQARLLEEQERARRLAGCTQRYNSTPS